MTIDQPMPEKLVGAGVEATYDFYGTTDDARPVTAPNGSKLLERDAEHNTLTILVFFEGEGWVPVLVFEGVTQGE